MFMVKVFVNQKLFLLWCEVFHAKIKWEGLEMICVNEFHLSEYFLKSFAALLT